MQSVHITTNVVSSSPVQARCTQYTYGRLVFLQGTPVSPTNKTDRHDIAEILLKVALNTNKQTNSCSPYSGKTTDMTQFTDYLYLI
jgi:hypothetical protein